MAHLSEFNTDQAFTANIISSKRLTPESTEEVREIIFEVNDPGFNVSVDQSFGVVVETAGDFGKTEHHRLYSVADLPLHREDTSQVTMLVKRCKYIDEFNGEEYKGIASNYLCDRKAGDRIHVTGPHALPFVVPEDKTSDIILIGMGTGIAPFRAFVKHIYTNVKDWSGRIRLFYGAKSGLELLYLNDKDGDLTNYYDEKTFEAFHALSPRPHWSDPIALDSAIEARAEEILDMLSRSNTYIYVAGYGAMREMLDKAFASILGSEEKWQTRKAELVAGKKWAEIIY